MRGQSLAWSYAGIVATAAVVLWALPGATRTGLVLAVSTDPHRLVLHPARSLLVSPFVVPRLSGLWLLPVAVLALGAAQRTLGARATMVTALLGHAMVSAVVAVLLERGDPVPDTVDSADVGVSYVLATVAGLVVAQAPRRWAWVGVMSGTALAGALLVAGRTSTDAGHLLAWGLGLASGVWVRTRRTGANRLERWP